jgi:hypothetical protein
MTESGRRQAILAHLARPAGRLPPGSGSPGEPQAGLVAGGNPFQAELPSVRFAKHRQSEHRHVYFVTFDGAIPQLGAETHAFGYVYALQRDPQSGWQVIGATGGAGDMPSRSTPWVNLGGGGWPDRFYAGGRIASAGFDIARVELRFANALTLVDDAEKHVALFITDKSVRMPATVVLYDRANDEVGAHPAF